MSTGGTPRYGRSLPVRGVGDVLPPRVAAGAAAAFAGLAALAGAAHGRLLSFDEPVARAIRGAGGEPAATLWRTLTHLGARWLIAPATVVLAVVLLRRCRQLATVLLASLPIAFALEVGLKALVARPRPAGANGFGPSFPSGHVLTAAAFWGIVPLAVYLLTGSRVRWRTAAAVSALVIALVAVSRVAIGKHWPSDVIGALLAGVLFILGAEIAVRRPWRARGCDACALHPAPG